jgi:hypothetical protein
MADKKISELPLITTISGSIVYVPIVHDGITEKITVENFSKFTNKYAAQTGSVNIFTANQTINANLSVNGTSTVSGNASVGGNLVVNGKLTAQEIFTEITSASVIFESGSTIFGNTADDTHQFTGIVSINGITIGAQALNEFTASQLAVNLRVASTTGSINTTTSSFNSEFIKIGLTTSSIHFTTQSLNTQTGSQDLVNLRISSTTGSINTTTSSFDSVFLRISSTTGSINTTTSSFDSVFLRISSTTGSINTTTSSFDSVFLRIASTTGSINTTTSSFDSVFLRISSTTGSINTTTSSFNSEFVKIGSTTSSIHFTTQSLNTQTGSQSNLNAQIGIATASLNFATGALNSFTGSVIGQTNTISTFTASVNFTTQSLNTQTGSQGLVNYQNSIITSSYRIELNSIEAYTASLKSAIVVSGTNVRIIGELSASRIYTEYITSSVLFVTGSNIIGDQSSDKHEFTGSVNIKDTLFVNGQAIGLSELNSFTGSTNTHILKQATQTGSQDLVNYNISVVTSSIDKHILNIATQTGSQQNLNAQIGIATASLNTYTGSNDSVVARILQTTASINLTTGSLIAIDSGLMAYTASIKAASIVSSSTQVQNYDVFALNSNLYNGTGSLQAQLNGIMAVTASMKAAAIVSSSQQVQNYFTFAKTGSANTFYGTQTISGDIKAISNTNSTLKSVQLGTAVNGTGGGNRVFDGSFTGTTTSFIGVDASDQGYGYFPATIVSGNTYTLFFKSVETNCTLGTIITSTGTNFATSTIQTLTLPSVTNGVYNTVTFTASASATHIGFAGYPTAGTITLTISEVSLVEGTADTNIGKLIVQRSLVANGDSMFNGNVTASGNLLVSTGNLVIGTSGGGIDFSATSNSSGTMASEILNDYEEGTWTPTNTNVSTATGVYTKIGRVVTAQAHIIWNGVGAISINGLPFTTSATVYAGSIYYQNVDLPANTVQMIVVNDASSTYITGYTLYDDGAWVANPVTKNGSDVYITLQYSV